MKSFIGTRKGEAEIMRGKKRDGRRRRGDIEAARKREHCRRSIRQYFSMPGIEALIIFDGRDE